MPVGKRGAVGFETLSGGTIYTTEKLSKGRTRQSERTPGSVLEVQGDGEKSRQGILKK